MTKFIQSAWARRLQKAVEGTTGQGSNLQASLQPMDVDHGLMGAVVGQRDKTRDFRMPDGGIATSAIVKKYNDMFCTDTSRRKKKPIVCQDGAYGYLHVGNIPDPRLSNRERPPRPAPPP